MWKGWGIDVKINDIHDNERFVEYHLNSLPQFIAELAEDLADKIKDVVGGWVLEKIEMMLNPIIYNAFKNTNDPNGLSNNNIILSIIECPDNGLNLLQSNPEVLNKLKLNSLYNIALSLFFVYDFAAIFILLNIISYEEFSLTISEKSSNYGVDTVKAIHAFLLLQEGLIWTFAIWKAYQAVATLAAPSGGLTLGPTIAFIILFGIGACLIQIGLVELLFIVGVYSRGG
jgi:hypothetical protein